MVDVVRFVTQLTMSVAEVPVENMAPTSDKSTTTVSTIAVQSGGTKLVLALLQVRARVNRKIQPSHYTRSYTCSSAG